MNAREARLYFLKPSLDPATCSGAKILIAIAKERAHASPDAIAAKSAAL
jgi:hypothetical protein